MDRFVLPFEKSLLDIEKKIEEIQAFSSSQSIDLRDEIDELQKQHKKLSEKIFSSLTDWDRIQISRHPLRPSFHYFCQHSFDEFVELHGDRHFSDDLAIRCGLARIENRRMMLIGHFRGENTEEKIACHFGYAHPEGYRKALLKMKMAEKFGLPIVCLVNTPGAYPGVGAEERNQSEALARNIMELTHIGVPVYCVIMAEGGSGGAIGIGVGDRLDIFEYAYLSVISPEGCASILWKDPAKAPEAAAALKCTSHHLKRFGIVDEVLPEPPGGAHRNPEETAKTLRAALSRRLDELSSIGIGRLLEQRAARIRSIGSFQERQFRFTKRRGLRPDLR